MMWLATWPSHTHTHANSVEQKWEHTYVYLLIYLRLTVVCTLCELLGRSFHPFILWVCLCAGFLKRERDNTHFLQTKKINGFLLICCTHFWDFFFQKQNFYLVLLFPLLCVPSYRNCYTDSIHEKLFVQCQNGKKILVRVSFILLGVFLLYYCLPCRFIFF